MDARDKGYWRALHRRCVKSGSLDNGGVEDPFHLAAIGALQCEEAFLIASSEFVAVAEHARRQQVRRLCGEALQIERADQRAFLKRQREL